MTVTTVAQPRYPDSLAQAIKERATRGLLLYNGSRRRIHQVSGDVWAVPASEGGFWQVDLAGETCPCPDFLYRCTDQETGEAFMCCKHLIAAAIARAKQAPNDDPAGVGYDRKRQRVAARLAEFQILTPEQARKRREAHPFWGAAKHNPAMLDNLLGLS
jgi:hypothetical protein